MDMEMDEINLAEIFDPEMIYSNISQLPILLSNYDDDDHHHEQIMSTYIINSWNSNYSYASGQEKNKTIDDMIIMNPNSSSSNQVINHSSNLTTSQVINFSSSSSGKDDDYAANETLLSQNMKVMCTPMMTGRTTLQARDHVEAERRRRENLVQLFISLSKVVPGLKKLDKASLLEDAINHLKALQERVSVLEKEKSTSTDRYDHHYTSDKESSKSSAADIKARISDKHVLIKIHCNKQNGLMSRVPCMLEKMHLSVVDMRIMPFGGQAHLHITVLAEMQSEFRGTANDIVEHLQTIFSNPCDHISKDQNKTAICCTYWTIFNS